MKQHPRPLISKSRVEAITASVWLLLESFVGLLLRLGDPRRTRRLERALRRAERIVECTLFLQAAAELGVTKRRAPRLGARQGFRKQRSNARLFTRCARVRLRNASPFARCLRLIDAIRDPRTFVARAKWRMRRGFCAVHLIALAPPARTFATSAPAPVPTAADSS